MANAENKTKPTEHSVESFLDSVDDEQKRVDSYTLLNLIGEITGDKPVMWGSSIIGFGTYHYKYASGREGDFMVTGFSPRKRNLTIYVMPGFDQYAQMLSRLGKYKTGRSCLYVKQLADIDMDVLRELLAAGVKYMREKYETR